MNSSTETCRRVEALLFAWADGALPETERGFVEAHLGACAGCMNRALWEKLARRMAARQADFIPVPAGLEDEIRRALETGVPERRHRVRAIPAFFRRPVFALAATLLLALTLGVFLRHSPAPVPERGLSAAADFHGTLICLGCRVHETQGVDAAVCHQAGIQTADGRVFALYWHEGHAAPWTDLHASLGAAVRVRGRMMDGMQALMAESIAMPGAAG